MHHICVRVLIIYIINNVCVALSYHTLFDGHNSLQTWRQVGQNFTFFVLTIYQIHRT